MQIDISSNIKDYTIYFSENFLFFKELSHIQHRIVIVDENVYSFYREELLKYFLENEIIIFKAIESNKNIDSILQLCDTIMISHVKKNITIISLGGGIVQDITGFLSSILYRGVNWIFIPTTLLAQADSCMGSKTSLNYRCFKNLLGSFYPPTKIYIDVAFIKTLNQVDFYSGIGEVVKLHLMGGMDSINFISNVIDSLEEMRNNLNLLSSLIQKSLNIKYSYIEGDEFDTGKRNLLNYGHCFGHALEYSSNYEIPHGIAVVIGIIFANIVSVNRGILSRKIETFLYEDLLSKCIKIELKTEYFNKQQILSGMKMDKKRIGNGLPLIIIDELFELHKLTDLTTAELFGNMDEMLNRLT
jgi:3-dehydroquinate synthase